MAAFWRLENPGFDTELREHQNKTRSPPKVKKNSTGASPCSPKVNTISRSRPPVNYPSRNGGRNDTVVCINGFIKDGLRHGES